MRTLDEYEPFFDAIRAADKQVDDARAGYAWAQQQDPMHSWEQHAGLEHARAEFRLAVEKLVRYILE